MELKIITFPEEIEFEILSAENNNGKRLAYNFFQFLYDSMRGNKENAKFDNILKSAEIIEIIEKAEKGKEKNITLSVSQHDCLLRSAEKTEWNPELVVRSGISGFIKALKNPEEREE